MAEQQEGTTRVYCLVTPVHKLQKVGQRCVQCDRLTLHCPEITYINLIADIDSQ